MATTPQHKNITWMDTRGEPSESHDATGIPNQLPTQQVYPELVPVSFANKITMALGHGTCVHAPASEEHHTPHEQGLVRSPLAA